MCVFFVVKISKQLLANTKIKGEIKKKMQIEFERKNYNFL